jgi:glutamate dehydrogenase/leucine dehydrogenase
VQGFGNVGEVVASELHAIGASVVAISDASGGLANTDGIDIPAAMEWTRANGGLKGFPGARAIGRSEVLEVPCRHPHPGRDGAPDHHGQRPPARLQARGRGRQRPDDARGRRAARRARHPARPDVLANAGGVCVSYFEWVQDQQKFSWDAIEIQERLRRQMRTALAKVWDAAKEHETDWRTAALTVAVKRVAEAARMRAIYP